MAPSQLPSRLALCALLLAPVAGQGADRPALAAAEVFASFGAKRETKSRNEYLKSSAGSPVEGRGRLEVLSPRSFYETSVPESDPVVALIQQSPGRKVACGLPRSVVDTLGWLREGSPVVFRGALVDVQDWGEWTTMYLSGCTLERREER